MALASAKAWTRLQLSRAKHPSLVGHAKMSRRVARQIPFYEYDESAFFASDGASAELVARRRAGFARLSELYRTRFPRTSALTSETRTMVSDLGFTSRYRVPYQYTRYVGRHLGAGVFPRNPRA